MEEVVVELEVISSGSSSTLGFSPAPITSAAGGGGGIGQPDSTYAGGPGGSGGGGGGYAPGGNTGGTGNTPVVSPAQGFNGGSGSNPSQSNVFLLSSWRNTPNSISNLLFILF